MLAGLELSSVLQQLFQQTYFLFLWWVLTEQTQYWNMEKTREEMLW